MRLGDGTDLLGPLDDLAGFADYEAAFTHVVQGGRVIVER